MRPIYALWACLLLAGCVASFGKERVEPVARVDLADDLHVERLAPGVWMHVSTREVPPYGLVASNGLVVELPDGVLLVDTAWTEEQTRLLLDWARRDVGPVRAALITHAHDDRLGGLGALERAGVESIATKQTARLAAEGVHDGVHREISRPVAAPFDLEEFGVEGELYFPGAGHSSDNATVWLPQGALLFGGCLVRNASTTTLGNTDDADLDAWPRSIGDLEVRYREPRVVVPGHGAPGGPELLRHTRVLLRSTP